MPQKGRVAPASNSGLSGKITKITAIVVALTGLLTAIVHFRDSIPWLTPVATINVTPSPVNLDLGDKFQILATVKDSKENPLGKKVTWSSANPSVAAVANDGIVTASGVGETTITASIGPSGVQRSFMCVASLSPPWKYSLLRRLFKWPIT